MAKKKTRAELDQMLHEIMTDDYDSLDILKVHWIDAFTSNESLSLLDVREQAKLIRAVTIGYLIDEQDDHIALCGFCFPDPHADIQDPQGRTVFRNVHFIPKKLIESIVVLKFDCDATKRLRNERADSHSSSVSDARTG